MSWRGELSFQPLQRAISQSGHRLKRLALKGFDRARAIDPGYAQKLFDHGDKSASLSRFEEALGYYNRGLRLRPNDVRRLSVRAAILRRLKRSDQALMDLDRALAMKPDFVEALIRRAIILRL